MPDEIKAVFTDGGVILRNPSEIGGTWAWCAVTESGVHVLECAGYLLPSTAPERLAWNRVDSAYVTNNQTEFYAAMRALETMQPGWSGILASDSEITLKRVERLTRGYSLDLPRGWQLRMTAALQRLGNIRLRHVPGHPSADALRRGYVVKQFRDQDGVMRPRQVRVSRHQVWCDDQCRQLAKEAVEKNLLVDSLDVGIAIMPSVDGKNRPNQIDGAMTPVGEAVG